MAAALLWVIAFALLLVAAGYQPARGALVCLAAAAVVLAHSLPIIAGGL
jgi:hypothetical protein